MSDKLNEATKDALVMDAKLRAAIYQNAIEIAGKRGWDCTDGLEALYLIFADKHHWTPEQVRHLSTEEIHIFLQAV